MAKKIKMVLYGEPGTGKSVFASKAPKPYFICTDGNYEWLEDFGADMQAHSDVSSWAEIKKVLANQDLLANYETIVIDLLEDAFKWCESEFCAKNRIDHLSDLGYGKGYDITRNEFFIEICKLLSTDKHVILIMHGMDVVKKDRRGVEHTFHVPSPRLPDKVLDNIEGRVRYFLRCYTKGEEQADGSFVKKRYLSLIPKENEFGICRGVDEDKMPQDINLDWSEFANAIGLDNSPAKKTVTVTAEEKPVAPVKKQRQSKKTEEFEQVEIPTETAEPQHDPVEDTKVEEPVVEAKAEIPANDKEINDKLRALINKGKAQVEIKETPVSPDPTPAPSQPATPVSANDKIAAIKNKLAALKQQRS